MNSGALCFRVLQSFPNKAFPWRVSIACQDAMYLICPMCLQEFPWIATEKEFFGKAGSDYDFEAQDVPAAFEEYEAANQSLQRLANKVNRKVRLHHDMHGHS